MSKELFCNKFNKQKRIFANAIIWKFDNRRVSVVKTETGIGLQFKTLSLNPAPCVNIQFDKGILHTTSLNISNEASELLLFSLAEIHGFCVCAKEDSKFISNPLTDKSES